jgi:hypothetical protein
MAGKHVSRLLAAWAVAVILVGGVLTSYHQPFRTPDEKLLLLMTDPGHGEWKALHLLSGGCGCSRRVMLHLLARQKMDHVEEQVLMVDDQESYLPDVETLLGKLQKAGFSVSHIAADHIPDEAGFSGVPLLVFASPEGKPAYIGGYGTAGDQDTAIYANLRAGRAQKSLNVIGCAVGSRVRRAADPLHLKY